MISPNSTIDNKGLNTFISELSLAAAVLVDDVDIDVLVDDVEVDETGASCCATIKEGAVSHLTLHKLQHCEMSGVQ